MNSREYWSKREQEQLRHNITDEREYDRELRRIYQNMLDACQKEIDSFYGKYAKAEGITLAEAKKRVSKHDVQAFERKAAKYVKDKDFSAKANEELRLYNATMKINRLEMLKANIGLETIAGHDELEKFMAGILKGRTEDELKRQAGILGKTVMNNAAKANAIVNGSFHSGTFSDRIWQYQDLMRQDLGRLLQQGLIQGKGARAIAKDLKKYWYGNDPKTGGGATYCMERLMRTELARVQTEAQKQSFVRNGFDKYIFIINHHASKHGCCEICEEVSKRNTGYSEKGVYLVKDMMPGENAPPMHPHCRCSVAAWEDDEEYEAWLDFLEKGGTTKEWDSMDAADRNHLISAKRAQLKSERKTTAETEKQFGVLYGEEAKDVNWDHIESAEFKRKCSKITDNQEVNESILNVAKTIFKHCDGTEHEDLYLLGMDGKVIAKVTDSVSKLGINYSEEFKEALANTIANKTNVIAIHNHPHGTPPSPDDFMKAYENKYGIAIVAGHNGQLYVYKNTGVEISMNDADTMAGDIAFFYEQGFDIDRASEMVYDGFGLKYTILEGVE